MGLPRRAVEGTLARATPLRLSRTLKTLRFYLYALYFLNFEYIHALRLYYYPPPGGGLYREAIVRNITVH